VAESKAIGEVFGERASALWVSSTKSMTGHMLGAAGAVETAVCALSIHHGVVPPTINLDESDPQCTLDYVPHTARRGAIDVALSNSFGFGGANVSLVLQRSPR
jgi:3-oxoacyl-[acyl-carrier-protein] synthase II